MARLFSDKKAKVAVILRINDSYRITKVILMREPVFSCEGLLQVKKHSACVNQ